MFRGFDAVGFVKVNSSEGRVVVVARGYTTTGGLDKWGYVGFGEHCVFGLCGAGSIGIAGFGLDIRECDDAFGWRSVFCVMYRR